MRKWAKVGWGEQPLREQLRAKPHEEILTQVCSQMSWKMFNMSLLQIWGVETAKDRQLLIILLVFYM